jgi:cellulose synthase/poly-beta-1,6-N-acetylglucosamine synthase-like glycosyltransferase
LVRASLPFLERFHETTAVGGIIRVANGCRIFNGKVEEVGLSPRWIPTFQVVEYLRAFLSGRIAWSEMNALLVISGAFSIFKRSMVLEAGGYSTGTVGEDMELVVRLHAVLRSRNSQYAIRFIPDPICWTEAPETVASLWRQRERWHRGLGQSLSRHWRMLLNPRFGTVGLVATPYVWGVELLSPALELAGYWIILSSLALGALDGWATAAFFLLTILMGILFSILAVILEEITLRRYPKVRNLVRLFAAAVLENAGYRQLTLLARTTGLLGFWRRRQGWGFLERRGLLGRPAGA